VLLVAMLSNSCPDDNGSSELMSEGDTPNPQASS
jgi:hypothetical protein